MLMRLLSVLLAAALIITVIGIIPASALEAEGLVDTTADADELAATGGGVSYVWGDYGYALSEDDAASVWSYTGSDKEIVIPSELDGHTVTSIGWGCFREKELTSVTIPDTVDRIDGYAFQNCKSLETVVLPKALKVIEDYVFAGCEILMDIELPDTLEEVGEGAFEDTLWLAAQPSGIVYAGSVVYTVKGSVPESLTFRDGTTAIASGLFEDNSDIKSVTLPTSLKRIGYDAFKNCDEIEIIDFPPLLEYIGTSAFEDCDSLTAVALPASLNELGDRVFHYCDNLTSITVDPANTVFDSRDNCNAIIRKSDNKLLMATSNSFVPAGVEIIGRDAFMSNDKLLDLEIPESVRVIEDQAFWGCSNLETVKFPSHVEEIGGRAFAYCYKLAEINLPETAIRLDCNSFEDTAWEKSQPDGVVYFGSVAYKYLNRESAMPEELALRDGTKYIAEGFIRNNDITTSVVFPASLLEIGPEAFDGCEALTSVDFPEGLTTIKERAFRGCKSIKTITIPDSVTFVGESAFENCDQLKTAVIGKGVDSIAVKQFSDCDKLETVNIPDNITEIGQQAFESCTSINSVTIPDSVTRIDFMAFDKCSGIETLYLGSGLAKADYRSFGDCEVDYLFVKDMDTFWLTKNSSSGLTCKHLMLNNKIVREITLPDSCIALNDKAFSNWKDLKKVTLNDGLISIGSEAFAYCDGLTEIYIPANVSSIAVDAFKDCKSLTSIKVDKNNKTFDSRGNCNAVINTEANVLHIGCPGTYIPDTVTAINSRAFEYCSALTEIRIPSSVTSIGNRAFTGSGLTKIVLPESVTNINGAFRDCEELKDIAIGNPRLSLTNSELGVYEYWETEIINNVLHIYKAIKRYDGIVIYGFEGSTAQSYANSNSFTFKPWADRPDEPPAVIPSYLGDADADGEVTVVDVTTIQRHLARLTTSSFDETAADVDGDTEITIMDATYIQRKLAKVAQPYNIGEPIN